MASAIYDKGRQVFLEGDTHWLRDDIKCVLVNIAPGHYAVDLVNDQFLSDIASGDRIAISPTLKNRTSATPSGGTADADDVTFSNVTGPPCGAAVFFRDTGAAGTSPLIAYVDTAVGLPATPLGGDILIQWDNGPRRIFKLG